MYKIDKQLLVLLSCEIQFSFELSSKCKLSCVVCYSVVKLIELDGICIKGLSICKKNILKGAN